MIRIPTLIWRPLARAAVIFTAVVLAFSIYGAFIQAQSDPGPGLKSGEELYIAACSNCHGLNGGGVPQEKLGFDVVPADFTDCSFASREPAADWVIIAHEGGPIRGFSRLMPSFGGVLTLDDLTLIMEHVKSFCTDKAWPDGSLNLPRAMFTEKAFPEDELVYTAGFKVEGDGEFSNELIYEKRFGARNQFELVVPFDWQNQTIGPDGETDWNGGVGDIALGVKRAFYHSVENGSILAVTGEIILPTGNEDKGFGKGTAIFEPFLSYGQLLPADFFIHAQAGLELPFDTDKAGNEAFWRAALGKAFNQGIFGRTWAPMMEVLGARELESGAEISWDLVPQVHFTVNTRQHIMMNIAARVPITDSGVRDTQVLVYLLWDWFDGGFFQGW
jgi:hypothetical protein